MIKRSLDDIRSLLSKNKAVSVAMISIFLMGTLTGIVLPSKSKLIIFKSLTNKFLDIISSNNLLTFFKIFLNNSFVGLLLIALGFTIFLPMLIILFNGLIIGLSADLSFRIGGLRPAMVLNLAAALLPHGIIELPALIICSILGLILGAKLFFKKKIMPKEGFTALFIKVTKIYIFIILPLLLFAAFVETFITPTITIGSSRVLFTEINKDTKLNDLALNQNDLSGLGFREISMQDYVQNMPIARKYSYLNLISILFYDDELYKEFKNLRNNPTTTKVYVNDKSNLTLLIQISEFESGDAANKGLILMNKIFNITTNENKMNLNNINGNLFKVEYEHEIIYQKLGYINNFSYSIRFIGKDLALVNSIIEKQELKLMKK